MTQLSFVSLQMFFSLSFTVKTFCLKVVLLYQICLTF